MSHSLINIMLVSLWAVGTLRLMTEKLWMFINQNAILKYHRKPSNITREINSHYFKTQISISFVRVLCNSYLPTKAGFKCKTILVVFCLWSLQMLFLWYSWTRTVSSLKSPRKYKKFVLVIVSQQISLVSLLIGFPPPSFICLAHWLIILLCLIQPSLLSTQRHTCTCTWMRTELQEALHDCVVSCFLFSSHSFTLVSISCLAPLSFLLQSQEARSPFQARVSPCLCVYELSYIESVWLVDMGGCRTDRDSVWQGVY